MIRGLYKSKFTFQMSVWNAVTFKEGSNGRREWTAVFDDDPMDGRYIEQRLGQSRQIRNLLGPFVRRRHQIDNGQVWSCEEREKIIN